MKKTLYTYFVLALLTILVFSCATPAGGKAGVDTQKTVFNEKYFFRPGADSYNAVNLKPLKPLMREVAKQLTASEKMRFQMMSERTGRIFSYQMGRPTYALLLGSYPKAILDSLLSRHPEWLPLPEGIEGFKHYEMDLQIGIPESNIIYMTTSSLQEAYSAPTVPRERILPAYVINSMDANAFTMYFPRGDRAFAKDNAEFSDLPAFPLLITMTPTEDARGYVIRGQFIFTDVTEAQGFIPRLESMIKWYKSYYEDFGELLDMLQVQQRGREVDVFVTYSHQDAARISREAVKTMMNTIMKKNYEKS